ncbi:MAG TPA: helix-turn-helix transcriptional regulator [Rhizomicrobium sp.]
MQLRRRWRDSQSPATHQTAALDALAFGVIVCDAAARIVFVNQAAQESARVGDGIVLGGRGNGLRAIVHNETRALAALIHDAASGGPGGIIRVTGRGGLTELTALVTPLPRAFELDGDTDRAYALVTLRSARDSPSFSAETLIALFGVSPAQAQIALAIYGGQTPEKIAGERGVAISTLRTHLAQIFLRTGTESQRDLVRLLGTLPPIRQ